VDRDYDIEVRDGTGNRSTARRVQSNDRTAATTAQAIWRERDVNRNEGISAIPTVPTRD
jgi:hypothetical protein